MPATFPAAPVAGVTQITLLDGTTATFDGVGYTRDISAGGSIDAAVGVTIPDNGTAISSNGNLYLNNTGADITPTVAGDLTDAGLEALGMTAIGGSGAGVENAAVGQAIAPGESVLASDGQVLVNNTGATITPAAASDLTTAGLQALGMSPVGASSLPQSAAPGLVVPPGGSVLSTDNGLVFTNATGANVTVSAGNSTALASDGLSKVGSPLNGPIPAAVVGTVIPNNTAALSDTGVAYINNTGADLTPGAGVTNGDLGGLGLDAAASEIYDPTTRARQVQLNQGGDPYLSQPVELPSVQLISDLTGTVDNSNFGLAHGIIDFGSPASPGLATPANLTTAEASLTAVGVRSVGALLYGSAIAGGTFGSVFGQRQPNGTIGAPLPTTAFLTDGDTIVPAGYISSKQQIDGAGGVTNYTLGPADVGDQVLDIYVGNTGECIVTPDAGVGVIGSRRREDNNRIIEFNAGVPFVLRGTESMRLVSLNANLWQILSWTRFQDYVAGINGYSEQRDGTYQVYAQTGLVGGATAAVVLPFTTDNTYIVTLGAEAIGGADDCRLVYRNKTATGFDVVNDGANPCNANIVIHNVQPV